MTKRHIDIVFDAAPGQGRPHGPRLVEVEDSDGRRVRIGKWIWRKDGYWVLRLKAADLAKVS